MNQKTKKQQQKKGKERIVPIRVRNRKKEALNLRIKYYKKHLGRK